MFYSWMSVGITMVNEESFKKFPDRDPGNLDPNHDPDHQQNLIYCSLGHAPSLQKFCQNLVINF